jgi:hypothetical protein
MSADKVPSANGQIPNGVSCQLSRTPTQVRSRVSRTRSLRDFYSVFADDVSWRAASQGLLGLIGGGWLPVTGDTIGYWHGFADVFCRRPQDRYDPAKATPIRASRTSGR